MQQLRRKEIEELSSLSVSSFDTMQLDYYPNTMDKTLGESVRSYMAGVLADLQEYAADFSPFTRESLLLVGNAGLGKTHAALAIAGEVLRQNYDVIYVSCPDFFGKLAGACACLFMLSAGRCVGIVPLRMGAVSRCRGRRPAVPV